MNNQIFYKSCAFGLMLLGAMEADAAVTIQKTQGWFESGYVTWDYQSGQTYEVYCRPEGGQYAKLDKELVRNYGSYGRADMVGLKAGNYQFKVVASNGDEAESSVFTAVAHDRSGFAHVGMSEGIGAYKNDGTLKDGAKVIYVYANNAATITTTVKTGSKATNITECVGLQTIIDAYQKGYDTTPVAFRIIGTVKKADLDKISSSAEGLQVKGRNAYSEMPITIEGIGNDATFMDFGILVRNCHATEFRNFAIVMCMDDCLSLDTENSNIWIHNMDFFYGNTGGDADQAKGDGTVDVKAKSKNCTVSYNHFHDSGKSSLGGMDAGEQSCWHTYHHNWFDHSDSRHPRIRSQFFHVYNNYYDGNSKYGVGATTGGSALVENNYFRNCKYPMLISKQGTDAEGDGTFSGEDGGVIKACNNVIKGEKKIQYYKDGQTDGKWDAVLVEDRAAEVSATALKGGTGYNNEADKAARTTYVENKMDQPDQVPAIVRGELGAGRIDHGDIHWTFNNSLQDENYDVVKELKTALQNYKSTLVGLADGTAIKNGGATETIDGGDGKGLSQEENDSYVPKYAGGGGQIIAGDFAVGSSDDYFWTTSANANATNSLITSGIITLDADSKFQTTINVAKSDGTVISDKVGSLQLAKETGYVTFHMPGGIQSVCLYLARTGSMKGDVLYSNDGTTFTKFDECTSTKAGVFEKTFTPKEPCQYIRVTNAASGSLHIQGLKIVTDGTTAAETVKAVEDDAPSAVYDVQGRKVSSTVKGRMYIWNHKKFIAK